MMTMDANYREVSPGKASPIAKASLSSELDRQLSPTNPKRAFGLRPSPGLVPLTTASGPSTNLWGLTKTSSFSSTASKFKPFSKYRTRRLSDDSLTDLSPPTHSDLDCISALWNVPTDQVEQQEPPSPEPSRRNSAIFLGSFKPSSLSHNTKSSKESRPASNMNLFKGQGAQPSFSSRLRLLSKNSPEKQASEKPKPPYNKTPTAEPHVTRSSLKPTGLKSFQNKAANLELDLSHSAEAEEIEAIKSPSCDIRIQAHPSYPPRSCSIADPPGVHNSTHELCRSSSSPNLNLPSTFSQRLSAESIRKNATINVTVSPQRSHAPPPIKVPKLRASSLAIAVGSDPSPVWTRSSASFRHVHSRSDGGNHFVRLITTLEWPGRKQSAQEHHVDASKQPVPEAPLEQTNPKAAAPADMSVDTFDSPSTSSATRNDMMSISNSLKVIKDKVPEVLPLQPAPRRLSHSRTDSKGPTMPLFISKHSRAVGTAAPAPPQNHSRFSVVTSPENVTRDPQSSAGQNKEARSSGKFSSTPTHSLYPETPRCHRSPIQDSPEIQEVPHARRNFSPGFIPFPTSEWPGQLASPSEDDLPSPSTNEEGDIQFQVELAPSSQTKNRDRLPAKKEKPRITSFDIRNFPLHLDTSQRSESLPSIAIPQSIKIPQFASGSLPSLPTSRDGHNPIDTTGELSSSSHLGAIRLYESSDLSSLRSVISNGSSAEAHRSMNRIFTPASTPISNRSTGFPLAQPSHKPTTPCYSARDSTSRSLSVDDFHLNINSNALLDLSRRRDGKKISRPRSMSDRGPNRYDIFNEVFGRSIDSIHNSPRTAMYSLPLVNHQFPQSTRWNTTSIAQMIRESTTPELDKLVTEALKTYHPDSHRFVTGDIKELIREGRQAEQKAEDLHRRYLADLHAREKLLHRQVTTSRALNGGRGARTEESLLKSVTDTDQLASELLGLIDHTSKIDRMCEAHWRAAATVQMNNLAMKEAQLEAAQSRIEQLESDRARHLQQISDLQAKIDLTQDQARPSSLDPLCTGSFANARMNSKGSYEFGREGFAPDSPSSTPRISQFPPYCLQQLPHTTFHRTSRFNSAHSLSSSHSSHSHSPCENSFAEASCPSATFPEPVSPRTAFLSSYGLSHNQAGSRNRSDSSSLSVIKNEPGPPSPRKTHLSNASLSALPIAVTTFQRSDSIGSRKKAGLIPRNILTTNNSIKPKGSISSIHFKTSRSSSLNSSDLKIEAVENKVAGSHDAKPRSTSNTFLPYLVNVTSAPVAEATPTDGSNEFQATNTASRGPSSSSLTRFPRQAAPAPKLPLPYESNTRRRAQWSPSTPVHGNLSSITLSQLGSNDIANLLSSIESRQ